MPCLCVPACLLACACSLLASDCLEIQKASEHVGETRCVSGKVIRVVQADHGVIHLDFCEDYRICPFSAVIFHRDLKSVGDVRALKGRIVEIHGAVKQYDGRAEIIVERAGQLGGDAAHLPPLPKNYDVEQRGHYSAGSFSLPKPTHAKAAKRQPVNLPADTFNPEPEE